jgi:shikimate dehydrogenase
VKITGSTTLFVIFGDPVEHSLSPAMQNAALQAAGIDGIYIPWGVKPAGLRVAFEAIRAMENFGGANVTIPHKEQAVSLVDELSSDAASVGAVNTLIARGGRLLGANTDGQGFLRSLHEEAGFVPGGRQAVILGAGGAARAVASSLAEGGVSTLLILNRTIERAQSLVEWVGGKSRISAVALGQGDPQIPGRIADCELLVNATSVGLDASDPPVIDPAWLRPGMLVCDLVYRPRETALLREAKKRGCRVLGGLGMLLFQGMLAFELWTGQKPSEEAMRRALLQAST